MTAAAALLETILADPDDDTARLVYADWLEERGDPRGEFIRVQMALAAAALTEAARLPLLIRNQGLLAAHEAEWVGPIREFASGWTFVRGFVEQVAVDADALLEHAEILFRLAPIQGLKIQNIENPAGQLAPLVALPQLGRLKMLDLAGNNLDFTGAAVLASGRVARLERLDLGMNFLDVDAVRALSTTVDLGSLRSLVLSHNHVRDMGAHALASSTHLRKLTSLELDFCDISRAGVHYLAEGTALSSLESLDLSHNEIEDAGVRSLSRSKKLGALRELRLQSCSIGATAARALADSSFAGRLRRLDLRSNPIARSQQETLHQRFGAGVCVF